jgi:hypothetical protein
MNDVYKKIFLYGINLSYILYFIVLFGITGYAPEYLNYLRNFLKVYIAVLLIVLYNPYTFRKKSEFGEFDRKLVFSSGIFLLLSTTLIGGIEEYFRQQGAKIVGNII